MNYCRTIFAVLAACGCAAGASEAGRVSAARSLALPPDASVAHGQAFLINLFDPELDLLPEFHGSKTYWLFHDNYLAARTLAKMNPELSQRILASLVKFGTTNSGKIEIVFNEARQPLPFRTYQLTNVARLAGKIVRTEAVTTNLLKGWDQYADLLLLASIAQAASAPREAERSFAGATAMWDGHGFNDRATRAMGIYSTYKLALYLIAADRLQIQPPLKRPVLDRLRAMQAKDGGWITDYKEGQPVGVANVETTCLAILALETQDR